MLFEIFKRPDDIRIGESARAIEQLLGQDALLLSGLKIVDHILLDLFQPAFVHALNCSKANGKILATDDTDYTD